MHNIYIPTKGRAETATTPRLLQKEGIPFTLVVEPQDQPVYADAFPNADMLVLEDNDAGIVNARQQILNRARLDQERYWQLDDNITGFYYNDFGGAMQKTTAKILLEMMEQAHPIYALAGPDYRHLAWMKTGKRRTINTRVYCCILTNTKTGINYDPEMEMKEDVDFCLQHLSRGWSTYLSHAFCFSKVPMGQNESGGLKEKYDSRYNEIAAQKLKDKWPLLVTLKKKKTGVDAVVKWATFKPRSITV